MDAAKITWHGDDFKRVFREAQDEALIETAAAIVNRAQKKAPNFIGNLRRAIGFDKPRDGARGFREVWIGFVGGIGDAFRYAMAVERGRRPGKQPPTEALKLWVEKKLGAGRSGIGQGSRRKTGRTREREIESTAYLVARKIGREGTRPQPFLMPAWDAEIPHLATRLKAALEKRRHELPQ